MQPLNRTSNLIRNTYILQTKTLPVQAYEERCIDTHNFTTYPGFTGDAASRLDAPTSRHGEKAFSQDFVATLLLRHPVPPAAGRCTSEKGQVLKVNFRACPFSDVRRERDSNP